VLVVLLLVVAAAGAALLVLERAHRSGDSESVSTPPVATPATPVKPKPHAPRTDAAAARRAAAAKAKARAAQAKAHAQAKARAKATADANALPAPIEAALADDRVVVVALYNPKAKIDSTAMHEAQAGALKAGSSFVPIDVRRNGVDALNARYGVLQDPAVLVLRPPGSLVVRIDGFADRETVAQAALNAAG
jgi:hypothetical protein